MLHEALKFAEDADELLLDDGIPFFTSLELVHHLTALIISHFD